MNRILKPIAASFAFASMASGAITWNTPQNIANDLTQISTTGDLVYAYNFTNVNTGVTTVNTVNFTNTNTASVAGSYTFSFLSPSTTITVGTDVSLGSGAYNGLDAAYKALIGREIRTGGGTANGPSNPAGVGVANDGYYNGYRLTLNGLTDGASYQIQIWINDSRNANTAYLGFGHLDESVLVDYNTSDAAGGIGQYVIGEFVATGTSQSFEFKTAAAEVNNVALLNAFQVRQVPEPSAALLGVLGLFGLVRRRR
ncbi:MAG: PEP-CTERM sorting domain-containing protein [Akkermansiaceae bacterium]|nr:PEP-CTERM sorting domain-containing protein [Akkermansiaceae bacterium]